MNDLSRARLTTGLRGDLDCGWQDGVWCVVRADICCVWERVGLRQRERSKRGSTMKSDVRDNIIHMVDIMNRIKAVEPIMNCRRRSSFLEV